MEKDSKNLKNINYNYTEGTLRATLNLLGIAQKAGKILVGNDLVKMGLTKRQIRLLILSLDISVANQDKFIAICQKQDIPFLILNTDKMRLGLCLGRREVALLGVTDNGFAKTILEQSTRQK